MKLLGSDASPYARKVRALAIEKGIDLEYEVANPMTPDSAVPAWNPLGKIPVLLRDDAAPLYDSRVIAEYLDGFGSGPPMIPPAATERIEVRRLEALADGVLDAGLLIRMESLRPEGERSPAWVERQSDKVRRGLAALDAGLGARDWYVDGRLTLADLACGACLGWLSFRLPQFDWAIRHPSLARLMQRLSARPSFATTAPAA
jgi:glutathione S-transferase